MSRNTQSSLNSSRPASRRLHRRLVHSDALRHHVPQTECHRTDSPQTLVALPGDVVRHAGMLELLAAELRIAELEKALEEATSAAYVDPLTGALNRRGFKEAYEREISRVRRHGSPLALVMIDLDDFKQINDTFGHVAGDQALVHLVEVIRKSMRPSDVLCRFGGEEFILLLPDTELEAACTAARRFLSDFAAHPFSRAHRRLTFSAGAVSHDYFETLDEAITRADAATYAAKKAGKNRVTVG